jgi:ABC-2 type transport system permease protein
MQQINKTESTFQVSPASSINITFCNWFNPYLDYKTFMVPGILVILVTMIGAFLSGMNIVKEKEIGTIQQLNVTPIKKHHFLIGKLLPFWIIALFELGFAKLVFGIPYFREFLGGVQLCCCIYVSYSWNGLAHLYFYR